MFYNLATKLLIKPTFQDTLGPSKRSNGQVTSQMDVRMVGIELRWVLAGIYCTREITCDLDAGVHSVQLWALFDFLELPEKTLKEA